MLRRISIVLLSFLAAGCAASGSGPMSASLDKRKIGPELQQCLKDYRTRKEACNEIVVVSPATPEDVAELKEECLKEAKAKARACVEQALK